MPEKRGLLSDIINISEHAYDKTPRILRGGSFNNPASVVRSAYRYWVPPAYPYFFDGFRPSRTYY